jgi:hypothetical protein
VKQGGWCFERSGASWISFMQSHRKIFAGLVTTDLLVQTVAPGAAAQSYGPSLAGIPAASVGAAGSTRMGSLENL